ncbi:MAG TPA: hypothetical protein VF331_24485 [Polyangiales bacterium]
MRASLAADGQQSPVTVVAADGGGQCARYVLIDGYVRVAALRALARDVVQVVVVQLCVADALIMSHRLDEHGRRSALEDGWLLDELVTEHGLNQQALGTRLSRSRSWVNRRLSLVLLLPLCAQHAVRDGVIAAQAAMKYLVPLSRDNHAGCERIVVHLGKEPVTEREIGRLYSSWRKGSAQQRERIEAQPRLFLRVDEARQEDEQSDTQRLIADLDAISGLCFRVRKRLGLGHIDRARRRLRTAFSEAERAFTTLSQAMIQESLDARPVHAHGDPATCAAGPQPPNDRAHAEAVS